MALAALSGDEQRIIFVQLCNVLDPGVAVAFGSASSELRELTQAPRQQLQADHEAAATPHEAVATPPHSQPRALRHVTISRMSQ